MKLLKMALAVMLLVGVAGIAIGAAEKAPPPDTKAATTPTAAVKAPPNYIHATLVKVDGKNLQVKTAATKGQPAKEMTVATDDKTQFILDYEDGKKLSDLAPDMTLTILPATGTAKTVKAHVKGLYGTVVKVDGKNLVIKATKTKKEVTVATDDKTNVVIKGKGGAKLSDLKAGTEVKIVPPTGTAAKVAMVIPQPAPKAVTPAKTDTTGKTAAPK